MSRIIRKGRRSGLALVIGAVAGLLMIGSLGATASAEPPSVEPLGTGCVGGVVCAFYSTGYGGEAYWYSCSEVEQTVYGAEFKSVKNNCGSHPIAIGWKEAGSTNWKQCIAAGGAGAENPGRFNTIRPYC
jgi:hypothetical protein